MLLLYRDHTYFRLISTRTGETLIELKMLGSGVIVWGAHYRPGECDVRLAEDGCTVAVSGVLRDGQGIVATVGEMLEVAAAFTVEAGELPPEYSGVVAAGGWVILVPRSDRETMRTNQDSRSPAPNPSMTPPQTDRFLTPLSGGHIIGPFISTIPK